MKKGTSSDKLMGSEMDKICLFVISSRKSFFCKAVSTRVCFLRNYVIYLSRILPIIAAVKSSNLLHPVYFFRNNQAEITEQQLLVQHGSGFWSFVLYDKKQPQVNAWVLYETKTTINETLLQEIVVQQDWLKHSFKSVTIIDYTNKNTLVPKVLLAQGAESTFMDLMTGSRVQTVSLEDAAGESVNLYRVASPAYVALNQLFTNAQWIHHESLVIPQPAAEDAIITVEIWFNTIFLFAQQQGEWLLLQQRSYQTPEDVLYHILNCKQQWNMGDDVTVRLQGMVEEQSALYNLLHQYIMNLELQGYLQFDYPSNTSDIPKHTKQLIDRILSCV